MKKKALFSTHFIAKIRTSFITYICNKIADLKKTLNIFVVVPQTECIRMDYTKFKYRFLPTKYVVIFMVRWSLRIWCALPERILVVPVMEIPEVRHWSGVRTDHMFKLGLCLLERSVLALTDIQVDKYLFTNILIGSSISLD